MTTPGSDAALPDEAARDLDRFAAADLPVGIPCFDNVDTVGGVVTAVEAGLRKHVSQLRAMMCASDGGSRDGTVQAVLAGGRRRGAATDPTEHPADREDRLHVYLVAARATDDPAPVVDTMVPLYYARTATFVRDTLDVTDQEAEALVEEGVDVAVTSRTSGNAGRPPRFRRRREHSAEPARPSTQQTRGGAGCEGRCGCWPRRRRSWPRRLRRWPAEG